MSSLTVSEQILLLCARNPFPERQIQRFVPLLENFDDWDGLLHQAEEKGLAPLLCSHLTKLSDRVEQPSTFLRGLRLLQIRHKQANRILLGSLQEILTIFDQASIPCLVLKGAALSQLVYPEAGYRPMRDIDLLIEKGEAVRAHNVLQKEGFEESDEPLPDEYYHLPPLVKKVEGMEVCVEIHSGIFPKDPPYYSEPDFASLYQNRQEFDVGGVHASAFANEEMLWHLYQHGFHAPITYEKPRLIALADIVYLVEKCVEVLDWDKLKREYPTLINFLRLLHTVEPWREPVASLLGVRNTSFELGTIRWYYQGWPSPKVVSREKGFCLTMVGEKVRDTFLPPKWWSLSYYGREDKAVSTAYCRLVLHPLHLLRWLKLFSKNYLCRK